MTNKELQALVARSCLGRLRHQGGTEQEQHGAAVNFMCGAASVLDTLGHENSLLMSALLVSVRGLSELEEMAKEAPQEC